MKTYKVDIKEFRNANKMTQNAFADYLGVKQSFIANMESGRDKIPDKYIRKILDDPNIDSSMIQVVDSEDDITIPRNVFEKISQLIETVSSQQNTISDQNRIMSRLVEDNHRILSIKYPDMEADSRPTIVSDAESPYQE